MREQKLKALVKQYPVNIENASEGGASSLYDSKISIGYHKYTVCLHGFSERWYNSRLFSCHFIFGGNSLEGPTGELSSAWNALAAYLFTYASFHHSRETLTHIFWIHLPILLAFKELLIPKAFDCCYAPCLFTEDRGVWTPSDLEPTLPPWLSYLTDHAPFPWPPLPPLFFLTIPKEKEQWGGRCVCVCTPCTNRLH